MTRGSGAKRNPNKRYILTEAPLNDNYMAVIKESHASILSRHELMNARKKILDSDFENDSRMWNKMKSRKMRNQQQTIRN